MTVDGADVVRRLAAVRRRIAAAGDPERVRVVAVTKGFGPDAVAAARAAGLTDVGENYAGELVDKAEAAAGSERPGPPLAWHFLGHVQRNKVRHLAPHVALWHGLDRRSAGEEIAKRSPGAHVLVQVETTGLDRRNGCPPDEVPRLVEDLRGVGLAVDGLMAMGPPGGPEAARPAFRRVRALADELGLAECSMGMSADLEVAVAEGATIVRVGTALFGPRPGGPPGPGRELEK